MSVGNLKTDGQKGNNFPWQLKMLLGQQCACDELAAINANTDNVEFLLTAILTSIQDGNDYEAKFVVDTCDINRTVYLEVRIWDPTPPPGSWGPITYYLPGSSTPVVPPGASTPGCLQYMDPTGLLAQIYNILNTRLDVNLSTRASESTLSTLNAKFVNGTDIGDVTINNGAGVSAVNIQDGGNSITIDATSLPLPTGAATEVTLAAVNTKLTAASRTPNIRTYVSVVGSTTAGIYSFSIANVGLAAGTVDSQTLPAGVTVNFDGGAMNNTLGAMSFDATGTTFVVTWVS